MKTIKIVVRDKIAVTMDETQYICGNSDFVVNFDFDAEWEEFDVKTVRFIKDNRKYIDVVLRGNECPVPIIYNTNKIMVGVFAGDLHTTTPAIIPAQKGILCRDGSPEAPSDDVYAQIMEAIDGGLLTGPPGKDGQDGTPGKDGVDGQPGKDGVSPVVAVSSITGGHRVTITDANGAKYFDVMDGKDGVGSGESGPGETGADGFSPTVSVTEIDGGHRVTITDINGVQFFDVFDGVDGQDGSPGPAGLDGSPGKDGQDGVDGVGVRSIVQTTTANSDGGTNVITVTLTNDQTATFNVKNGSKGSKGDAGSDANVTAGNIKSALGYTPADQVDVDRLSNEIADLKESGLSLGIASDGLIYLFVDGFPVGTGIPQGTGETGDLFGYVDENNTVVLKGSLADGNYTIKYEMEDGSTVNIGNLVLDSNVYYSIKNNLTNCTSNNSATQVIQGESYSAVITANSGYELSSVVITMGGLDITESAYGNGYIVIKNVTGNVVITAVAEEIVTTEPTNFFIMGGDGYLNPGRASSSGGDRTDLTTCFLTNYIEVQNGDEVYAYGAHSSNGNVGLMALYKANKTGGVGFYVRSNPSQLTNISMSDEVDIFTINYADAAFMRICCLIPSDLSTIKVNIKRNGEWL